MNKNKLGSSFDKQEEILNFLKSDCPEIFSEGKVDCKKLKQTLGEEADDGNERYGLSWNGKSNCFKVIQEQTTATLKLAKDESVGFNKTQNLFIEGDNLEVLKVLQRSYYGKVKMIYIDPPYNTGGDFIYSDNFRKTKRKEMIESGELDGNGDLTRIDGLSLNRKDSNGHFHSDWLNMMYPRLFLARNLLQQDGVIFVSIDDNEVHNLRMMMNEIFGEENFIGSYVWNKKNVVQNDARHLSVNHEYILVFSRDFDSLKFNLIPRTEEQLKRYNNPDNDPKGNWTSVALQAKSGSSTYEIEFENGVKWKPVNGTYPRLSKESLLKAYKENRLWFGKDGKNVPRLKKYLSEVQDGTISSTLLLADDVGSTQLSKENLKRIMGNNFFDTPKPVNLMKRFLQLSTNKKDLILDFFAGSGTIAQAVMEQNAKDEGSRKWICIQLPELCDEGSEAYKAGYKTIAEIGKERIRRAGKQIVKEGKNKVDAGFKVLKLDKSNFKVWQGKFENTENLLNAMADFVDNVEKGSKEENILFELILKSGLDLNVPVEEKESGGEKYYSLDGGKLIVYLGKKITKELSEEIQKAKPEKFICLDGCFQNNDQLKTNISLQMEQEKIDFKVI